MYVSADVSETVKIQCGRQQIHSSGSIAIVFGLGPCVVYPVTVKYTSGVPPMSKHHITPPVCVQCRERARIRERRRVTVCDRDCSACRGGRQSESDAELYRATERVWVHVSVCERATHRDRECARKREGQRRVLLYDAEEPLCVHVRGRERKRDRERK